MIGRGALYLTLMLAPLACGDDEIPEDVLEATKPAEPPAAKQDPPPLTPSDESFENIPTPTGAKHAAMVSGRFRYLIEVTPGEVIGYMKNYVLPGTVELDGAATQLRNAVAKKGGSKNSFEVSIRPATPGWTQVEITPGPDPSQAEAASSETETLKAAEQAFQ